MRRAHKVAIASEVAIAASALWMAVGLRRGQPRVFGHACQLMTASIALETLAFRFDAKPDRKDHDWALKRIAHMKLTGWRLTAAAASCGLLVMTSLGFARALKLTLPVGIGGGMLCFAGTIQAGSELQYAQAMRAEAVKEMAEPPTNDPYLTVWKSERLEELPSLPELEKVKVTWISLKAWKALRDLPKLEKVQVLQAEEGVNLLDPPLNVERYVITSPPTEGENKLGERLSLAHIELRFPNAGWHLKLVGLKNLQRIVLRECVLVEVEHVRAILHGGHLKLQQILFYGEETQKFSDLAVEDKIEFRERKRALGERVRRKDVREGTSKRFDKDTPLDEVRDFMDGDWGDVRTLELAEKLPGLKDLCSGKFEYLAPQKETPAKLHILNR